MQKSALKKFLSHYNVPVSRMLQYWVLQEKKFSELADDADISLTSVLHWLAENNIELIQFSQNDLSHYPENDLWQLLVSGSLPEEEKKPTNENLFDVKLASSTRIFYDNRRNIEFKEKIARLDWIGAFQLANTEMLKGNQQYFSFWYQCLQPSSLIKNQAREFFSYVVPENPMERTDYDWYMQGLMYYFGLPPEKENKQQARECFERSGGRAELSCLHAGI